MPDGISTTAAPAAAPTWCCASCGHRGPGDAVRLAAEADLSARVLLELRPPKNRAASTLEQLLGLELEARQKLGPHHWTSGAAALVLHYRARSLSGGLDAVSVACGCRFLGWLLSRGIATPPAAIVRTPVSVATDCTSWLTGAGLPTGSKSTVSGDHRCIAARLLGAFLLPIFDASGTEIAHVAGIGRRVAELKAWYATLQGTCGWCNKDLTLGKDLACSQCSQCKQVRYCSRECQKQDWKQRHKAGCLPVGTPFELESLVKRLGGI